MRGARRCTRTPHPEPSIIARYPPSPEGAACIPTARPHHPCIACEVFPLHPRNSGVEAVTCEPRPHPYSLRSIAGARYSSHVRRMRRASPRISRSRRRCRPARRARGCCPAIESTSSGTTVNSACRCAAPPSTRIGNHQQGGTESWQHYRSREHIISSSGNLKMAITSADAPTGEIQGTHAASDSPAGLISENGSIGT